MEKQSTIVCKVLEKIGATDEVRKWMTDSATTFSELINLAFILKGDNYHSVVVGSLSEGTFRKSYKSDVDILRFCDEIEILENASPASGETCCIIEYIDSKPGYIHLVVHGKTEFEDRLLNIKVLPSGKRLLQSYQSKDASLLKHGPAQSNGNMDMVQCISSPWPSIGNTWKCRQRLYNWPSIDTQQILKDLPCIVVQAGHPDSPENEKYIEWRLSFTLQENHLMRNLNDTQYKCYILLKLLKEDMMSIKYGESLTSYHCKTALFYTIEQSPPSLWRSDNMIPCLVLCLQKLHTWTIDGFCPHYFMPSVDLFLGKVDKQLMPKISEVLQNIIMNPVESLKKLTCSNYGKMLSIQLSGVECNSELMELEIRAKEEMIGVAVKMYIYLSAIVLSVHNEALNFYEAEPDNSALLDHFLNECEPSEGTFFFYKNVIPPLFAFLASRLVARSIRTDDLILRDWLLCAAALRFMNATDINDSNINVNLRLAMVLYATGHKDSAAIILDKVQRTLETYRTSSMTQEEVETMPILRRIFCYLDEMGQTGLSNIFRTPLFALLNKFTESEMALNISEIEVVPKCFVLEFFSFLGTSFSPPGEFRLGVVNFHLYLTYLMKQDNSSLQNIIFNVERGFTYLFLGWDAKERGYYLDAANLFYQSWKNHEEQLFRFFPKDWATFHKSNSSAKIHLLVLMYKIWRSKRETTFD